MATVFAGIVTAMVALLQAGTPVSAQIHRARVRPLSEDWTTAVAVRLESAELDRLALRQAPINSDTTVIVECYARSTSQSPDLAADALLAAVYARLAADPTLGGTVADLQPLSLAYDFDLDADRTACVSITYLVRHRTQSLSLE